ncbi:class I SAM-dependent methyltransferase [Chitinophaga solisilvae]|uniref:class I SAM-dependent methyltransferase n=1 Tax=Chitinophaga solisilvae TaxID=1233460 RepID=UPI001371DDC0|nr:class I SAM-dependent methyltransferase [Chitinophaga solisilvae]
MEPKLSQRLKEIAAALPLHKGIRVLEIGCGPGVAARYISTLIGSGYILAIDRSAKAIAQAEKGSQEEIAAGHVGFRQAAIEHFVLQKGEKPFDIAFAVRVGALDGRHPEIEKEALTKIAAALTPEGKLYIDGGNPLREIRLDSYRNP